MLSINVNTIFIKGFMKSLLAIDMVFQHTKACLINAKFFYLSGVVVGWRFIQTSWWNEGLTKILEHPWYKKLKIKQMRTNINIKNLNTLLSSFLICSQPLQCLYSSVLQKLLATKKSRHWIMSYVDIFMRWTLLKSFKNFGLLTWITTSIYGHQPLEAE